MREETRLRLRQSFSVAESLLKCSMTIPSITVTVSIAFLNSFAMALVACACF